MQRYFSVTTPDGRTLDAVEAGVTGGPVVVVHGGTPSGYTPLPRNLQDLERRGGRWVGYARPGYAGSSRRPGRDVASAVTDVAVLLDALGVERFVTWGGSGGGPHALACAALLPDRCAAAATLAGVAPCDAEGLDFLARQGEGNRQEWAAALAGEDALRPLLEKMASGMLSAGVEGVLQEMRTVLSPPDQAVVTEGIGQHLVKSTHEALRDGVDGWLDDDLAFTRPWGFDLDAIRVPLQLWQGEQDLMVPAAHAEWLAARLPGVDAHILPSDGHLTLAVTRIGEVHEWLLSQL